MKGSKVRTSHENSLQGGRVTLKQGGKVKVSISRFNVWLDNGKSLQWLTGWQGGNEWHDRGKKEEYSDRLLFGG